MGKAHDTCLVYPNYVDDDDDGDDDGPSLDREAYRKIAWKVERCTKKDLKRLCRKFPWLKELFSEHKAPAWVAYKYDQIEPLMPDLKRLYEKLTFAGVFDDQ